MMASKSKVHPPPEAYHWKLQEILATGISIGVYLTTTTVIFVYMVYETSYFQNHFHVSTLQHLPASALYEDVIEEHKGQLASVIFFQVSTITQVLVFATRSRKLSILEWHGLLLAASSVVTLSISTAIAATATWEFAGIRGIGWLWAGVIWRYNIAVYVLLDPVKLAVQYALQRKTWRTVSHLWELKGLAERLL